MKFSDMQKSAILSGVLLLAAAVVVAAGLR